MEYFRLRVFVTVCECLNYTKAAKKLGITQPSVSQNIAYLENQLGVELFARRDSRGGMVPTPAAKIFLGYAQKILKDCDDVRTVFNPGIAAIFNKVSIRASQTAIEQVLPQVLETIRVIYPSVEVEVSPDLESPDVIVMTSDIVRDGSLVLSFDVVGGDHPFVPIIRQLVSDALNG